MHGRRAAVLRQQRRVHVDHTEPGRGENGIGQNLAVGGDDAQIGSKGGQRVDEAAVFQPLGLQNRHARIERAAFHRRIGCFLPAAPRPIGLRHDADHVMPGAEQRVERRHGKCWRAEKDNAQRHHFPARVSFRILRTMRSRLMPRSRSTNNAPSR